MCSLCDNFATMIPSFFLSVWRSQIGIVTQAARILLQYLLSRLQAHMTSIEKAGGENEAVQALSAKQLLLPIKSLCSGFSTLSLTDDITLHSLMKTTKLPPHIAASLSGQDVLFSVSLLSNKLFVFPFFFFYYCIFI